MFSNQQYQERDKISDYLNIENIQSLCGEEYSLELSSKEFI